MRSTAPSKVLKILKSPCSGEPKFFPGEPKSEQHQFGRSVASTAQYDYYDFFTIDDKQAGVLMLSKWAWCSCGAADGNGQGITSSAYRRRK